MAAILQEAINVGTGTYHGYSATDWYGTAWKAQASYVLTKIIIKGFRHQSAGSDGTIRLCVYAADALGKPTGSELDHADMAVTNFPQYPSSAWVTFTLTGALLLSKNNRYCWYAKYLGGTASPFSYYITTGYTHGHEIYTSNSGVTWSGGTFADSGEMSEIWGETRTDVNTGTITPAATTASGAATITGGDAIDEYGFDYTEAAAAEEPETYNYEVTAVGNPGASFNTVMTGLSPSTWYWARAKVHTTYGWLYGTASIFQTSFDPVLVKYENLSGGGSQYYCTYQYQMCQTFTPFFSHQIQGVKIYLAKSGALSNGLFYVKLYATTSGKPSGSALATATMPTSQIGASAAWYNFTFGAGITLTASTLYALVMYANVGTYSPAVHLEMYYGASYAGGVGYRSQDYGVNWTSQGDWNFEEWGTSGVETYAASDIQALTAQGNGFMLDATNITKVAFEWGTEAGVYTGQELDESGTYFDGLFGFTMTGLSPLTTYFYRAKVYHTTYGWLNGNVMTFTTTRATPRVRTDPPTNAGEDNIDAVGYITEIGAENCDTRGFVYDLEEHSQPDEDTAPADSDYSDYIQEEGDFGVGSFTLNIPDLQVNKIYHVRAWAHNSYGYHYGEEVRILTNSNINILYPTSDYSKGIRNDSGPGGSWPHRLAIGEVRADHWTLLRSKDCVGGPGTFGSIIGGKYIYERNDYNDDLYTDLYGLQNPYRRTEGILKVKWKANIMSNTYGFGDIYRKLYTHSTLYTGTDLSPSWPDGSWECELFYTNLNTGDPWTLAEVDALIVGIELGHGGGWGTPACDALHCVVCWANAAVTTLTPTNIAPTQVYLRALVTEDESEACTVYFEYGETVGYGSTTDEQTAVKGQEVTAAATIEFEKTYHCRAVIITDCGETFYGADVEFAGSGGIRLELALNQSIFTEEPEWTEISLYLKALHIERGRMHELDRIEAGTATFTLDNSTGQFWRGNADSDFWPYIKPLTLCRLRYAYGDTVHPIFYGVTESFGHDFLDKDPGDVAFTELACVDVFKSLSKSKIRAANPDLAIDAGVGEDFVYVEDTTGLVEGQSIKVYDDNNAEINTILQIIPSLNLVIFANNLANDYLVGDNAKLKKFPQVKSGTRVRDVLLEWGWPSSLTRIDDGQVDVIEFTPPTGGTKSLEHIQAVAEAEDGLFFVAADGYITFLDSIAMIRTDGDYAHYSSSQATFLDDTNPSKYAAPKVADEDEFIFNEADISGDGITEQSAILESAQGEQGQRAMTRTDSQIANEIDAFNQCFIFVQRYKDSIMRPHSILVKPESEPDDLFPKVLGFDLKYRITLQLDSVENPAGIDLDYHIEGLSHDWNVDGVWLTHYQLWETNQYRTFLPAHDGYLLNVNDTTGYQDCHDAAESSADPIEDDPYFVEAGQWDVYALTIWLSSRIERGYLEFDTSDIDAGENILEAFVLVYMSSSIDRAWDLVLVDNGAVEIPLEKADYGALETMGESGTDYGSVAATGVPGWHIISLNAAGIAHIQKEGTTRFALRSSRDIAASDPGEMSEEYGVIASAASGARPPRLIVRLA